MERRTLGTSGLTVSAFCLGSMTWGSQNSEREGHDQIDRALAAGVDFIDTAEMYPTTPGTEENVFETERIIGSWIAASGRRDDVTIATKVTGPGAPRVRGGVPISGRIMREAVEGSLRRLNCETIDLYQLHWANRGSYHMRQHWRYDPTAQPRGIADHVDDVLETAAALIREGKIRALGLSNETTWGAAQFMCAASAKGLPRVVSMQNEYSLLCRLADTDMAELCHHEQVAFLAWSPLAAGLLSGKYLGGARPKGSRGAMQDDLNGRITASSLAATERYAVIARDAGMTPAQLALAFVRDRPFVTSTIIGATTSDQLEENLAAADITLSEDVLAAIEAVRRDHPMPM